jgi:glycosyltransferase involved in cell wall biosynthesis
MVEIAWFDARSWSKGYTTGWERYASEIGRRLLAAGVIEPWEPSIGSKFNLLASDLVAPKQSIGHRIAHFPTYPPLRKAKAQNQIFTLHDLTWWKFPETASLLGKNYYKFHAKRAILESEAIIVPSRHIASEVIEQFKINENLVRVIQHGNSLPNENIVPFVNSKPYFLSVGTIEPRKNLEVYAQAISKSGLLKTHDFIHIGRDAWGTLPSEFTRIRANLDKELASLVKGATALVMPSIYEGFGLPMLEAHALGIAVIANNIGALRELQLKEDVLVDCAVVDDFVSILKTFADKPIKLSETSILQAQLLNWDLAAKQHQQLYEALL